MPAQLSPSSRIFASHLDAAAAAVRIGVGFVPPALALLLADANDSPLTGASVAATQKRMDAVWQLVEESWDRVLAYDSPDLFYEIWSDRFALANAALER